MASLLERGAVIWREAVARFAARNEKTPIATVAELHEFCASRSAFIAQKKLYGYLKARMGTRYPAMFEDDVLIGSINIAKMHVFAACLSDMIVFAVALAGANGRLEREDQIAMARESYRLGIAGNRGSMPDEEAESEWLAAFDRRIEDVNWANVAAGGDCFTESPTALFDWAPIAPQLKQQDEEIVRNSIRFAWIEVKQGLRKRLDANAVAPDWQAEGEA
jgi:hypothetical protein